MASIPLPALHVNPPEQQAGPLQQYAQVLGIKNQMQQQQENQIGLQQKQQALADQQAMTKAMQSWDGKDVNALIPLVMKNGASANAVMGLKSKVLEQQKTYSDIAKNDAETGKNQTEILKAKNDTILGGIQALKDVPDAELPQRVGQTIQQLTQEGVLSAQEAQQASQFGQIQDPAKLRQALDVFSKLHSSQSQQIAKAQADAAAQKSKDEAAAAAAKLPGEQADSQIKQAEAASIAQGGMTQQMADSKYRSIQMKSEGMRSPDDNAFVKAYEKQKTLVPTANFNLQMGAGQPLEKSALDNAAEKYFQTGSLPAGGRGPAVMAQNRAIMNRAAELHPGESITEASANYAANKDSLKKLQGNFDQVSAFENTAGKNLDVFLNTAKKVVDSGSPLANRPLRTISDSIAGSENQAAFAAARTTALTEIAKVLNSSNASGVLSDSARHEVSDLIGPDATLKQIYQAANILKQDMKNRHDSYQEQISDIRGRMSNKPAAGGGKEIHYTIKNGVLVPE